MLAEIERLLLLLFNNGLRAVCMNDNATVQDCLALLAGQANKDVVVPIGGCLDLRRTEINRPAKRIRRSLLVHEGVVGLQDRFSWLPPRTPTAKELVVLFDEEERDRVTYALRLWKVCAFVEGNDVHFWSEAERLGLTVDADQATEAPDLLFEPSELAQTVVSIKEDGARKGDERVTLLDLGCGAGRDMAWIVRRQSTLRWRVSGIDHIWSIIRRARMLAVEFELDDQAGSGIDSFVQAQSNADGSMQALPVSVPTPTLQRFAKAHLPYTQFDVLLLVRFLHLPLLSKLPDLTRVGSMIAIAHFTTVVEDDMVQDIQTIRLDYEAPMHDKRFERHHVSDLLDRWTERGSSWRIVRHYVIPCEDGRPLRNVIFERTL